jgi:hypothetical protein
MARCRDEPSLVYIVKLIPNTDHTCELLLCTVVFTVSDNINALHYFLFQRDKIQVISKAFGTAVNQVQEDDPLLSPLSKYIHASFQVAVLDSLISTHTNFCESDFDPDWSKSWSQVFTLECLHLPACQKPYGRKCFTHLGVRLVELMR